MRNILPRHPNGVVPSKETIQRSILSIASKKNYSTYQKQYIEFCDKRHVVAIESTTTDITDFFHELYTKGKSARTISAAKSAIVNLFKKHKITPNIAQDVECREYVGGALKYNKTNNIEEEKKAHPLSVYELSCIITKFSESHNFIGALYRFVFCVCYFGCFRISETLNLRFADVAILKDEKEVFVSVRLRWHKKASTENCCQIYSIPSEPHHSCLNIVNFYQEYLEQVAKINPNLQEHAYCISYLHMLLLLMASLKLIRIKSLSKTQLETCWHILLILFQIYQLVFPCILADVVVVSFVCLNQRILDSTSGS